MTNTIGSYICSSLASVIPVMLDEDATNDYPYAVYAVQVAEANSKAGCYKLSGTLRLRVYADDYATAKEKGQAIKTALAAALRTQQYRGVLTNEMSECLDGLWQYDLDYNIAQYDVPVTPETPAQQNVETTD